MSEQPESPTPEAARAPAPTPRARSCAGCGERVSLEHRERELVRLVIADGGMVAVDSRGSAFGRGAYVHPRRTCLERAAQRGLSRAAKAHVTAVVVDATTEELGPLGLSPQPVAAASGPVVGLGLTGAALAAAIHVSMLRRAEGLLGAAARAGRLEIGVDAVTAAYDRERAALIVVATDAAAAADSGAVLRAVREGKATAAFTKAGLAALVATPYGARAEGIAVVAVTSDKLASAILHALRVADLCRAIVEGKPEPAAPAMKGVATAPGAERKPRASRGGPRGQRGRAPWGASDGQRVEAGADRRVAADDPARRGQRSVAGGAPSIVGKDRGVAPKRRGHD